MSVGDIHGLRENGERGLKLNFKVMLEIWVMKFDFHHITIQQQHFTFNQTFIVAGTLGQLLVSPATLSAQTAALPCTLFKSVGTAAQVSE